MSREDQVVVDVAVAGLSFAELLESPATLGDPIPNATRDDFNTATAERSALFAKMNCPASIRGVKPKA